MILLLFQRERQNNYKKKQSKIKMKNKKGQQLLPIGLVSKKIWSQFNRRKKCPKDKLFMKSQNNLSTKVMISSKSLINSPAKMYLKLKWLIPLRIIMTHSETSELLQVSKKMVMMIFSQECQTDKSQPTTSRISKPEEELQSSKLQRKIYSKTKELVIYLTACQLSKFRVQDKALNLVAINKAKRILSNLNQKNQSYLIIHLELKLIQHNPKFLNESL